ncbi:HelD family protein [Desertimonas flava]|uniref:HelD family protein n=1 Tax=Desertimonas flava TaxID=2064846 RepID=UPI000E34FFD4|nr:AAA family ATPase [Desertimonas flava]
MDSSPHFDAPADPFPELAAEREHLAFARRARDRMIDRLQRVDPHASADEITAEYVEMTVAEALDDLSAPGAGDFFGRIDVTAPAVGRSAAAVKERYYIGRRHIEDDQHDPVVVDWRAPVAAAFYRATPVDPLDVSHRRRFTLDATGEGPSELTAYLDEHLDDPDAADVAGGIPDPVLAEIGAARTGAMREIVATIQGEQDVVIRAPIDQVLIVQGGPGTGKTAVALHRAAFLMFEHRRRLSRDGVLVIGPNKAFLDYISHVLPSLGERSVRQCTVAELCVPKVEITAIDDADTARAKGSTDMLDILERAVLEAVRPPDDDLEVPIGSRVVRFTRDEIAEWLERSIDSQIPVNERRQRLRAIAQQELRRRTGGDEAWPKAAALRSALNAAWPTQQPLKVVDRILFERFGGARGKKRAWTLADQLLVDEANSILNGPPLTYAHVVVDEAQDHSAVGLRVIGRRSPARSMTLVGDVAQSTTPAGQERWADVARLLTGRPVDPGSRDVPEGASIADLTIGYRVPDPILARANELLPSTGVDATPSRSVRLEGREPWHRRATLDLGRTVGEVVAEVRHRHRLTGVVAPVERHVEVAAGLESAGFVVVDHVHELGHDDVPLFGPEQVKGLEFDGVVVVGPDEINDGTPRGARLLYVAMTRAVQELAFVDVG